MFDGIMSKLQGVNPSELGNSVNDCAIKVLFAALDEYMTQPDSKVAKAIENLLEAAENKEDPIWQEIGVMERFGVRQMIHGLKKNRETLQKRE